MIIADTSVWVVFLRDLRAPEADELDTLLAQDEIAMTGVVLAEVLQGARSERDLNRLQSLLTALPYVDPGQAEWSTVGELSFRLRRRGITIPITDLAIAAVALANGCAVYTLDEHFERTPGLKLHVPGAAAEHAQ